MKKRPVRNRIGEQKEIGTKARKEKASEEKNTEVTGLGKMTYEEMPLDRGPRERRQWL